MTNLNVSVFGFITFACYALIYGFMVRGLMSRYPDSTITKALGFIY